MVLSLQQDGTLEQILEQRHQLQQVLAQLCGAGAPKEANDNVRAALAESILMLVSVLLCFVTLVLKVILWQHPYLQRSLVT